MPYEAAGKHVMLNALAAVATHVGLHSAVPSTGTPNEISGGSPAYARKSNPWNAASGGAITGSSAPVFDVPSGASVAYVGFWSASSGGTLYSYDDVTVETFGAQGTYTLTSATQDLNA